MQQLRSACGAARLLVTAVQLHQLMLCVAK
jgi:hypothetical protein